MILLWAGLLAAAVALFRYSGRLAADVTAVTWPPEEPLNPHDNRASDPHLAHLARVLTSDLLQEAHTEVVEVTRRLVDSGSVTMALGSKEDAWARLGPGVAAFLENPPLHDPPRYRRELATVLTRIEQL